MFLLFKKDCANYYFTALLRALNFLIEKDIFFEHLKPEYLLLTTDGLLQLNYWFLNYPKIDEYSGKKTFHIFFFQLN